LSLRYCFAGCAWSEFLSKCESFGFRGALIGPYGSGKTTLLEDLEIKLRERDLKTRLIRAPNDHPDLKRKFLSEITQPVETGQIVLVDGAEQIGGWAWRRFKWQTRNAGGLIITAHQPGLLPTLWKCATSPELLRQLAAGLLDRQPEDLREISERLFQKHEGNLRAALRECYDLAAAGRLDRSPNSY
jgi:hypothetical protein